MIEVANKYIDDVLSGREVVGQKAYKAVLRHVNNLENADEKGWFFCEKTANFWLKYLSNLRHTKGKWARKKFQLHPWQVFATAVSHGWLMKGTGLRRFRKVYIRVPRKGGKSEWSAGVTTGHLLIDDEEGAECYCAATNLTQAKMVYTPAAVMMKMACKESKSLAKKMVISRSVNNPIIKVEEDGIESFIVPLTKNPEGNEGSNPSFSTIDEYHLHPDNEQVGIIETGMGTRDNPMLWIITTAGFDISLPCYEYEQVALQALDGLEELDRTFVLIYDLDDGDEWRDMANWKKANPGWQYGTPNLEYLTEQYNKAKVEGISSERAFRVKHLNQWWNQSLGWIDAETWALGAEKFDPEDFEGRECYMGLDLAANKDFNSLCIIIPPRNKDEKLLAFWRYYCPDETVKNPKRNEGTVMYQTWAKQGYIRVTDGNVTDYDVIEDEILRINEIMPVKALGFDRYNSYSIIAHLIEAGIDCKVVPQSYLGESVPMKSIERFLLKNEFQHGANPVTDWMLGNVAVQMSSNEDIKLDREKKKDKIDGIAALVDAVNVWINGDFVIEKPDIRDFINAQNFKDKQK